MSYHFLSTDPGPAELTMAGVLAVTRSLGDASMKEFVVGSPYTTETTLDNTDEFLIVACDGVGPTWHDMTNMGLTPRDSCGTCARISRLSTSSVMFKTRKKHPRDYSTTP